MWQKRLEVKQKAVKGVERKEEVFT